MSVKLMALVYEAHFRDISYTHTGKKKGTGEEYTREVKVLAPNLKSVCLALADHANDEGEGAYPSIWRLEWKTELSRPSVISCLTALKKEEIIARAGISKRDTINYTVNKEKLTEMTTWERQKREKNTSKAALPSKAALLPPVKPLYKGSKAALPEPSSNHPLNHLGALAPQTTWDPAWAMSAGLEVKAPTEQEAYEAKLADAVNMFLPVYQSFAKSFILASGIFPLEKEVSGWSQAFKDQQARTGLSPLDITDACKKMTTDGLTIKDPFSVMANAGEFHTKASRPSNRPVPKVLAEDDWRKQIKL